MIERVVSQNQRYILIAATLIILSGIAGISVAIIMNRAGLEPRVFLVLLLSVVLWLVLVRYFEIALALIMIGFPFYILFFNTVGLTTSSNSTFLFYFLVSTSAFVGAFRQNRSQLPLLLKRPNTIFLFLFTGWMGLNWLIFSFGVQEGLAKLIFGLLLMLLPYLSVSLYTPANLNRFILVVISLSSILLVLALLTYLLGGGINATRFSLAENISPLGLAYYLGTGSILAFVYAIQQRRLIVSLLVGLGLAGVIFVTLLTLSRGPVLALALSILMIISLAGARYRLQIVLIFILLAVSVSSVLPLVSSFGRYQRLVSVVTGLQETGQVDVQDLDVASAGRITIWQISVSNWSNKPVTGIGLGNTGGVGFAHNFLLETLVELGLFGLFFLLIFLIITVANLVRLRFASWQDQTFYLVATGLFVYSLVQGAFSGRIQTLTMLWIAAGMVNALIVYKSGSTTLPVKAERSI